MKRGEKIKFSSTVRRSALHALKELIYLNPCQKRDEPAIVRAIEEYGQLEILEIDDALRIHFGGNIPQSLFAYDEADPSGHPVGVVMFSRTRPDSINIVHIAVNPDYSLRGKYAGLGLGVVLIERVLQVAARVAGVRTVTLYYRKGVFFKMDGGRMA